MGQLASNLQELYVAVHENKDVVPNYRGTHVYATHSFLGRAWTVIFRLLSFFHLCEENHRKEKLCQAIEKTQQLFEKQRQDVYRFGSYYQNYLKSQSSSCTDKRVQLARRAITEWNETVAPFLALMEQEAYRTHRYVAPFFTSSSLHGDSTLHRLQQIVNLEKYVEEPLPLNLLAQLAKGEKGEAEAMQTFIKCVHASQVTIGPFHEGLACFIEILEDDEASLARLEYRLSQGGLELFLKKDAEHVEWRDSLQPSQRLTCNGREIVLGEQIGKKVDGEDDNFIFVNNNHPDTVIIIGKNRVVSGVKKMFQEKASWGIRSSRIIEIDSRGRFMIAERLKEPFSRHRWAPSGCLARRDQEILQPIVQWIRWMVNQKRTPGKLSAQHLMFDGHNRLRSAKIHFPGSHFNFVALEDFCFDVAKGNLHVFSTLMTETGLREFPYAFFSRYANYYSKFFKEILQHALNHNENTQTAYWRYLVEAAHNWKIECDVVFFERMVSFYNEALALKKECLKALAHVSDDTIGVAIAGEIENFYDDTRAVTRLWPSMREIVIKRITAKRQLSHAGL